MDDQEKLKIRMNRNAKNLAEQIKKDVDSIARDLKDLDDSSRALCTVSLLIIHKFMMEELPSRLKLYARELQEKKNNG